MSQSESTSQASGKMEEPLVIEETDQFRKLRLNEPTKAATARTLALILIWTFAAALGLSLVIGVFVLWKANAIDDKTLAASTEFLKAISSVFTPLLAFVLGFYFSKREE
jgi:hypothetical protein